VYFKHLIYTFFVHVTVIFFSGSVVIMSLDMAGSLDAWVKDMLIWILNIGLLCSLAFLFRSRKVDCSGYLRFDGGEELSTDTLQLIDDNWLNGECTADLTQWHEGMELPPLPRMSRSEPQNPILS
jgi:hypothetical protein